MIDAHNIRFAAYSCGHKLKENTDCLKFQAIKYDNGEATQSS